MPNLIGQLFHMEHPPTAIIATNDMILEQVLIYAKNNHLTIPNDFSLIGIDDVSFASFYNPPITTVSQPSFEMGEEVPGYCWRKLIKKNRIMRICQKSSE